VAANTEHQLVGFNLEEEKFGVDIMDVQEIIKIPEITRVPKAPSFVEGVINLRGQVLPVIDCRKRFDLDSRERVDSNRIIVINIEGKTMGIIVDSVSEVLRLPDEAVEPPPPIITGVDAEYLDGIGKMEDGKYLISLLNLKKFLNVEEMGNFSEDFSSNVNQKNDEANEIKTEGISSNEVQLVGFKLSEEEYAVGVSEVQEIIRVPEITRIPKAPPSIEGVINLRDKVLPILSLRKKFDLKNIEKTDSLRIIVVNAGEVSMGMIVDSVSEVLRLSKDTIEPPPSIASGIDAQYLKGIGKLEEGKRLLLLLDLVKLLTASERKKLSKLGQVNEKNLKNTEGGERKMAEEEQLVSFKIENEEFGVGIEEVQEIIRLPEITRVPKAPSFVEGVINLRGNVLPVIDLRKRFDLEATKKTNATRIVVVNVDDKTTGIIVDSVSEVLRLSKDAVEPPPPIVAGIEAKYLRGIGKLNDGKRLIVLLDLNEVLTVKEKEELARMELKKSQEAVKKHVELKTDESKEIDKPEPVEEPVKLESAKPRKVDQPKPVEK